MSSPIRMIAETSDWLRRLRASKGFPDTDGINLEGYLSRLYKQADHDLALIDTRPDLDKSADSDAMPGCNNVPSELIENPEKSFRNLDKISCSLPLRWTVKRRRTVKKIYRDLKMVPFPLARTLKHKRTVRDLNREIKSGERLKVEEKCDLDLSGSSKTEVTNIKTSDQSWISKNTYMRKNVWEVGDKKGKSLMSSDKFNTGKTLNDNGDGDVQKKKFHLSSSSKSWAEHGDIKKKRGKLCNSSHSAQISKDKGIMRGTK